MVIINTGFAINTKNKLVYLTIPSFEQAGLVKHCFTTRLGGVSEGIYESLNTSFKKGDLKENVIKNLSIICEAVEIDFKKLVLSNQKHEDNVYVVTEKDIGKGISQDSDIDNADALITNVTGIPLMTFYADCVPIFILDKHKKAIALIHSGWRSTVRKIAQKTLNKMIEVYGTDPKDCLIGIGPSIEMNCFEVGSDVADVFKEKFSHWKCFVKETINGKYNIDLWKANYLMLMEAGVCEDNITISGLCTVCNDRLFFSHRRDNGNTGSLSAIMQLI